MSEDLKRLAAADAGWWLRQAAEFFSSSVFHRNSARARLAARKHFLDAARKALPVYGLEPFWDEFKRLLHGHDGQWHHDVAEAAIRELWAELQREQKTTARQVLEAALTALGGGA